MAQVVIENPILISPFEEPTRRFRFADDGITDEIVDSRRVSSYHGGFGRWVSLAIRDPWNTQTVTREILTAVSAGGRNGVEEATA